MTRSPFVRHEGRWYVVKEWERGIQAGESLTLKPLTVDETAVLEGYRANFDAEAWAVIVGGRLVKDDVE